MEKKKVAFIGLGVMGYPMAGFLAKAGHDVTVFNRTKEKAEKWVNEYGGHMAATPAQAAKDQDVVFACVGNDDDVRSVTTGENGAFAAMKEDSVFVDHTTASATLARELGDHAEKNGFHFLDAPVSGGQKGAEEGILTIMVGGSEKVFHTALPFFECYGKAVTYMGQTGNGQLTKMVNQLCIAGVVQGLAEAMAFAINSGIDPQKAFAATSKGSAQSWQMENRY